MGDWWIIVTNANTAAPVCFIMKPGEVKRLAHRGEKDGRISYWLQPRRSCKARKRSSVALAYSSNQGGVWRPWCASWVSVLHLFPLSKNEALISLLSRSPDVVDEAHDVFAAAECRPIGSASAAHAADQCTCSRVAAVVVAAGAVIDAILANRRGAAFERGELINHTLVVDQADAPRREQWQNIRINSLRSRSECARVMP